MFRKEKYQELEPYFFTYIIITECCKTTVREQSMQLHFIKYTTYKIPQECLYIWEKWMPNIIVRRTSISTPSEVTGLGLFVQLPKNLKDYKNQNSQNWSEVGWETFHSSLKCLITQNRLHLHTY